MIFNSVEFAIFLPIVFMLYWFVIKGSLRMQNFFLIAASYFFYGWWDWRFLSLIIFSSIVDYSIGLRLKKTDADKKRKALLFLSILVNIGFLGFFKYYNFFVDSFVDVFTLLGKPLNPGTLNIILPVGISFYTFQTLSYTIDVYRRKLKPTNDILAFFAFVSFFPQLVAGPIERATHLLPQFYTHRKFDYHKAVDGLRQILWGLFKKIVIADNCAVLVNDIFATYPDQNASTLFMGAILFAFQIYGDFSGYSDIAIGTSRLFGFDLMHNFAFPYFSRDIAEFWRRWHISLSTWFRDYLYIPLGGSKGGTSMKIRNTFIIFIVSGFWHGANWTFIVWGALNALFFLPLMLLNKNRSNLNVAAEGKLIPSIREVSQIATTFILTVIAWIFFRAETITDALQYLVNIFNPSFFEMPYIIPKKITLFVLIMLAVEWVQREKKHGLQMDAVKFPRYVRWAIYYAIVAAIMFFGSSQQEFIYFQF